MRMIMRMVRTHKRTHGRYTEHQGNADCAGVPTARYVSQSQTVHPPARGEDQAQTTPHRTSPLDESVLRGKILSESRKKPLCCVINRRVGLPERKLYEFELVFIEMRM
jgi:hypothetical protein